MVEMRIFLELFCLSIVYSIVPDEYSLFVFGVMLLRSGRAVGLMTQFNHATGRRELRSEENEDEEVVELDVMNERGRSAARDGSGSQRQCCSTKCWAIFVALYAIVFVGITLVLGKCC